MKRLTLLCAILGPLCVALASPTVSPQGTKVIPNQQMEIPIPAQHKQISNLKGLKSVCVSIFGEAIKGIKDAVEGKLRRAGIKTLKLTEARFSTPKLDIMYGSSSSDLSWNANLSDEVIIARNQQNIRTITWTYFREQVGPTPPAKITRREYAEMVVDRFCRDWLEANGK